MVDFIKDALTVYINAESGLQLDETNGNFVFNNIIPLQDYDRIVLTSAEIPKTYYLVDDRHNTFIIDETGLGPLSGVTITIPIGTYSFESMRTTLNATIAASALTLAYNFTAVTSLGKYRVQVAGAVIQPTIYISDARLRKILGFGEICQFVADEYIGLNVVNFQLTNSILIQADIVERDGVLQDIIANEQDFNSINYINQNPEFNSKRITQKRPTQIVFKLLDFENNRELMRFNGNFPIFTIVLFSTHSYFSRLLKDEKIKIEMQQIEREENLILRNEIGRQSMEQIQLLQNIGQQLSQQNTNMVELGRHINNIMLNMTQTMAILAQQLGQTQSQNQTQEAQIEEQPQAESTGEEWTNVESDGPQAPILAPIWEPVIIPPNDAANITQVEPSADYAERSANLADPWTQSLLPKKRRPRSQPVEPSKEPIEPQAETEN